MESVVLPDDDAPEIRMANIACSEAEAFSVKGTILNRPYNRGRGWIF